jgi:hypothetical protein
MVEIISLESSGQEIAPGTRMLSFYPKNIYLDNPAA